jgi:hypothetical protein
VGILGEIDAATNLGKKGFNLFKYFGNKEKLCDDYYYEEYNKKIFVKKNGDGLVVSSCNLKVIDPIKTDSLIRTLDISDAKKSSCFEPFDKMRNTSMENIFSEYGFWFRSDNDIVTDVEEFYEDKNSRRKDDNKFISVKFMIDTTKLEKNRTYKIVHAFSVPGLFPIKDGRFDVEEQDRKDYNDFRSYVSTEHIGHHLRFAAYFENGIEFKEKPSGNSKLLSSVKKNKKNSAKNHNCVFKDNIFYKKYHFEIENPQDYTDIYMKWNVKNPLSQK